MISRNCELIFSAEGSARRPYEFGEGEVEERMWVDVLLSCQYLVVELDDHLVRLVASSQSLPMLCYGQIEYYHLLRLFAMATGDQYVCDVGVS